MRWLIITLWVASMLVLNGQSIRFALMSDYHVDYPDFFDLANNEPADNMEFIQTLNPSFLIDCGDELYYAGTAALTGLVAASNIYATNLTIPHYHVPGNHDGWIEYSWPADYWTNTLGAKHFAFNYWACAFIGFQSKRITDAGVSNDWGHVDADELAWVEAQLIAATNGHRKPFLFLHHPVITGYGANPLWPAYGGIQVSNLCTQYGVWFVFSGHEHVTNKWIVSGTFTNINLPSLAQSAGAVEGAFNIVTIGQTSVTLECYLASPSTGYPRLTTADRTFGFVMPPWSGTAQSTTVNSTTMTQR